MAVKDRSTLSTKTGDTRAVNMSEAVPAPGAGPQILNHLSKEELHILMSSSRSVHREAGEFLFRQADPHDGLHIILSGRIRSFYISPGGREITLGYWPGGHFVGAPQVLGGGEHMWSSVATEPTDCIWIPCKTLHRLIREIPSLALGIIEGLEYKGKLYAALLQIMGTQSISMRLARLLLTLGETEAKVDRSSVTIYGNFSQEELATLVGATRQSVSLTLDRFEHRGLIERKAKLIRLINIEGLKEICF